MITFDLSCERAHRFEGWFRNRESFEEQLQQGLVQCPVCGSTRIRREPSAVAVHVGRRSAPAPDEKPDSSPEPRPEALFVALTRFIEKNFEDVGPGFAEEARKIHRGEAPGRNIRGTTTPQEEESLREEGVEFVKLTLPKYDA